VKPYLNSFLSNSAKNGKVYGVQFDLGLDYFHNISKDLNISFGTKENPTNAMDVIKKNQAEVKKNIAAKAKPETKPKVEVKSKPANKPKPKSKTPKVQVVEKFQYKSGKNKK
jgi:hypothetical protein